MEIKLKVPKGTGGNVIGGGFEFCKDTFVDTLQLDDDVRKCFIVASKKRPNLDDAAVFTLSKARNQSTTYSFSGSPRRWRESRLLEIRPYFYEVTKTKFAALYDAGYRYLHVEY